MTGSVFAIKRYALHDGPDLRVTVFFKGCPLACLWCHNPEGLSFDTQMYFAADKCVGCGACLGVCPGGALQATATGIVRDKAVCTLCGACARICPALAQECVGKKYLVDELVAEIAKEAPFFEGTRGGVTVSGGEPLAQPQFLLALLQACGQRGWHRAVDTSGFAPWQTVAAIAEQTDLFLFDLKLMDNAKHQTVTGVSNTPILDNARRLAKLGVNVRFRLPLIPGINDDEANIVATGEFLATLPGHHVLDLLPYHASASSKYHKLGLHYPGQNIPAIDPVQVAKVVAILQSYGLIVCIGG